MVFTDPAHHRAVTKRPLIAVKGGPQFSRFFYKELNGEYTPRTTIQAHTVGQLAALRSHLLDQAES